MCIIFFLSSAFILMQILEWTSNTTWQNTRCKAKGLPRCSDGENTCASHPASFPSTSRGHLSSHSTYFFTNVEAPRDTIVREVRPWSQRVKLGPYRLQMPRVDVVNYSRNIHNGPKELRTLINWWTHKQYSSYMWE